MLLERRTTAVLLCFLLALAVYPRCTRLGTLPITSDEAFSWRVARYPIDEIIHRAGADNLPPGHLLTLKTWMALFGESPETIRLLSACFGIVCVPMVYLLCFDVSRHVPRVDIASSRAGALFAALAVASHALQITTSRTARMYSMGAFLAAMTTWLACKAVRVRSRQGWWWLGHGLAGTAFAFTHNFALLSLAGQYGVAWASAAASVRREGRSAIKSLARSSVSIALVLALYGSWVPSLLRQTRSVLIDFWSQPITLVSAEETFIEWLTGTLPENHFESAAWCAAFIALSFHLLWRRDAGCASLIVQATTPWLIVFMLAHAFDRPLMELRYFTFAHIALLCAMGVAWASTSNKVLRTCLFCSCLIYYGTATVRSILTLPDHPPAICELVRLLSSRYRPGDVIIAPSASALNRLKYYCAQAGLESISIRCYPPFIETTGHVVHIASLRTDDLVTDDVLRRAGRAWLYTDDGFGRCYLPQGWFLVNELTCAGYNSAGTEQYVLALFCREDAQ